MKRTPPRGSKVLWATGAVNIKLVRKKVRIIYRTNSHEREERAEKIYG